MVRKYGMVRAQLQPKHHMHFLNLTKYCSVLLLLSGCQVFQGSTHHAEIYMGSGQYDAAISELSVREANAPNDREVRRLLARAYRSRAAKNLNIHDCQAALNDYESAAKREPRLALNYRLTEACFERRHLTVPTNLAHILFTFGDLKTETLKIVLKDYLARSLFEKADPVARTLAARQVWSEAHAKSLANHAMENEVYHAARYWLLKLVRRQPTNAYLMTRAAMVSMALKDYATANRLFTRVHHMRPENRVILVSWRKACSALGRRTCVQRINGLLNPTTTDRELRALPKSRR